MTNERTCRVLRILCTRPRGTRHGRARTWSSSSRHALFVYLGTADRACCASREALRAGKKIRHWDDRGTNVAGDVYASTSSRATSKLSHLKCRSPWMSPERDGRGATPYVTCQLALRLSRSSLMLSMGSLGIRTLIIRLRAGGSAWTADLIRACVLPPTACTSSNAIPDPRSIDRMLSLHSSQIRKGMTTTRHSRTRKVVRWAIARSAWMQ